MLKKNKQRYLQGYPKIHLREKNSARNCVMGNLLKLRIASFVKKSISCLKTTINDR